MAPVQYGESSAGSSVQSSFARSWNRMELQMIQVGDALFRLKQQLALRPPILDKAIEDVQRLRSLAAEVLETSKSGDTWELAHLKPQVMIHEKQTGQLKQEIAQLTGLMSQAERREIDVQHALRRAKVRNGQLLVEMQDLREQLEMQRSRQTEQDISLNTKLLNLEHELAVARSQAEQHSGEQISGQSYPSGDDRVQADLWEKIEETQQMLEDARDRATDLEMECDALRRQLQKQSRAQAEASVFDDVDEHHFAQRLEETQRLLDEARDRSTDAEMECESLRKQLQEQKAKSSSEMNLAADDQDGNLARKLAETQNLLEHARDQMSDLETECDMLRKQLDRATDAEMECESLRKQLQEQKAKSSSEMNLAADDQDGNLARKLAETQNLLENARDQLSGLKKECESSRDMTLREDGKTHRELDLERRISKLLADLGRSFT